MIVGIVQVHVRIAIVAIDVRGVTEWMMGQYFSAAQSQPVPHVIASPTQLWVQKLEDDPSDFLLNAKPVEERSWYGSLGTTQGGYSPLGRIVAEKNL